MLAKTTYDKVFIAKEAKTAVQYNMENWPSSHTLMLLIEHGIKNKLNNKKLIEESHVTYTTQFVKSIKRDGPLAFDLTGDSEDCQSLTRLLTDAMDAPPRIKKSATENLKTVRVKVLEKHNGKEENGDLTWATLVKKVTMVADDEAASEAKAKTVIELSKPTAAKKPAARAGAKGGLRDFLKNKKKAAPAEDAEMVIEVMKD